MEETKKGVYKHNDEELVMRWYKEPMTEIPEGEGFGFKGAIMQTTDGEKILCNECGGLYTNLGAHVFNVHRMRGIEYKEKFGLAYQTTLLSDTFRTHLKNTTLRWLASLSEEEKQEIRDKGREGLRLRKPGQPKQTLETKNKRGTCPDQLLDKIKEVTEQLGRTPSKMEFIQTLGTSRHVHKIYETFGSWTNALNKLGMEPRKVTHSRGGRRYADDELLEYLAIFSQENNKIPTHTDFKNTFLPSYDVYQRRFGGIEKARQLAGCYDYVDADEKELKSGSRPLGRSTYNNQVRATG